MLLGEIIFKNISSVQYGLKINYSSVPLLPEKRSKVEYVAGRDGGYTFIDGFKNRVLLIEMSLPGTFPRRRTKLNEIAAWLYGSGELVLGIDPGICYEAKVLNEVSPELAFHADKFTVAFECKPIRKQRNENSDLTWDMVEVAWSEANIPWEGHPTQFSISQPGTINLINMGTYISLPIIVLSGDASSVSLTDQRGNSFTYSNLVSGTPIYIDSEESVVYSLEDNTPVNQMANFSDSCKDHFFELDIGENLIAVDGTFTDLSIYFKYRNSFL